MFFVFLIDTLSTKTKTKTHNTCYLLLRACFFCSTHASLSMVNTIHRVYIECPSYKIALSVVYVCMYVWYCIHTFVWMVGTYTQQKYRTGTGMSPYHDNIGMVTNSDKPRHPPTAHNPTPNSNSQPAALCDQHCDVLAAMNRAPPKPK